MLRAELLSCDLRLVPEDLESSEHVACCPCVAALAWDMQCRATLLQSCPHRSPRSQEGTFPVPRLDPEAFAFLQSFYNRLCAAVE